MNDNEQVQESSTSPDTFETPYDLSGQDMIGLETVVDFETLRENVYFPGFDAEYPERDAAGDPKWAVWIVWIWTGIAWFCLLSIITLLILGIFYD